MFLDKLIYTKYLIFFLFAVFVSCNNSPKKAPIPKKGKLDLSSWSFEKDGLIKLKGEWEFYYNKFYFPQNFKENHKIHADVYLGERYWNKYPSDSLNFSRRAYATYRLIITCSKKTNKLFLESGKVKTASRLFLNGEKIYEQGLVADNEKDAFPNTLKQNYLVNLKKGENEVILHVSNFFHRNGGVESYPTIGKPSDISDKRLVSLSWLLFIFGVIIIIGFYHLTLFFLDKTFKSAFYFGLLIFIIAVRILIFDEEAVRFIFPDISWLVLMRISFFTFLLPVPLFGMFVTELFAKASKKKLFSYFLVFSFLIFTLTFILKPFYFSFISEPYYVVILLSGIYLFPILAKAIKKNRSNALNVLVGTVFLFLAAVNDILVSLDIINHVSILGTAAFIFIFLQTYFYARSFSLILRKNEGLATGLQIQNTRLEQIVDERTLNLEQTSEELKRINAEKDRFVSIISHDLKGPISGLMMLTDFLIKQFDQLKAEELNIRFKLINSTINEIYKLLENLLEWSRVQSGKTTYRPEKVNIFNIVNENIGLLKGMAVNKNIELKNTVTPSINVSADYRMMNTILRNLISNAIKFSYKDSKIIIGIVEKKEKQVYLYVKDFGVGIPEKHLNKIFSLDKNFTSKGTNKENGTGLGLVLCEEFARLHNTTISIDTKVGEGSTFGISLHNI